MYRLFRCGCLYPQTRIRRLPYRGDEPALAFLESGNRWFLFERPRRLSGLPIFLLDQADKHFFERGQVVFGRAWKNSQVLP